MGVVYTRFLEVASSRVKELMQAASDIETRGDGRA